MELSHYQQHAQTFARYPQNCALLYPLLALQEEAGEVSGKVAKHLRKGGCLADFLDPQHPQRGALISELGDVLWQLAAVASGLSVSLEEVARLNLHKLAGRAERGTIVGEGDER